MKPEYEHEQHQWQKRLVTLRPVPGLLHPVAIVVSMTASPRYHHIGRMRSGERHVDTELIRDLARGRQRSA